LKYASKKNDSELVDRLMELARQHPRWGARQLRRSLHRQGEVVNLKHVRRLCKLHGLRIKPKRRKKRLGIGAGMPCRAEYPNHVWAYDFVEDRTEMGQKLRILTVIDEFSRRCIEVEVEHKMNAKYVARTLMKLWAIHGTPTFIRSDNGPEFIARFLMNIMKLHGVAARHIDPGSPWQNGKNERFNGTLRDECLNMETFHHRDHARAIVKLFARMYNQERPHSSLGEAITPSEFYEQWKTQNDGCATRLSSTLRLRPDGSSPKSGGEGTGLALGAPPAGGTNEKGLTEVIDQPISRKAIHVGAPVAPQQSRTLRVDKTSVPRPKPTGAFPANNPQPSLKT
jgi:putative transposase